MVPLTFAALLSMLLLPIAKWLESKGINKALAALASLLVLIVFFAIIIGFISWQISDLVSDSAKIEQQVTSRYQQIQQYISEKLGIAPEKQQQMLKQQQATAPSKMSTMISGFLGTLGGFVTDLILVLVYIFLFIYFRARLKEFIIRLVPDREENNTLEIVNDAQKIAQKYLTGLSLMIVSLWIMYGIGFSIVGVKNAVFFAILCGILEIVPFVGNLVGTGLTVVMSLIQGGDMNMVIGILITYGLVQFIQTYILEPLVVGAEVSINPLFTIIGLVAGELLWGIPGMILAIPLMGITKIICDHVEPLKPYGYLIGEDKKEGESGFKKKLKHFGQKIMHVFHK
jgi:predicted PurR-regulated permease PerM